MSNFSRRTFVKTGSLALAAAGLPYRNLVGQGSVGQILIDISASQDLRALTAAALDAAKSNGATYADAHFQKINRDQIWNIDISMGFSVRAFVNGYWGFAAMAGLASTDDVVRLGREAALQAKIAGTKASARGKTRTAELAPVSVVANGSWSTPVEIDPFTISVEEKADFQSTMEEYIKRNNFGFKEVTDVFSNMGFNKQETTFASTEGAYASQTIHTASISMALKVRNDWLKEEWGGKSVDFFTTVGAGWEYVRNAPYRENLDKIIEEALRSRRKKPIDVGRYNIVFDAKALSNILSKTIVQATELDRAFGYEANRLGTSYITEPLEMLLQGDYKMGSPLLNVTTNRSMKGGAGTAKWDDEGVEPVEATIIKDGILTDMQTTRESATWISEYYKKKGIQVRSNGCAGKPNPTSPMVHKTPNIVMAPGKTEVSFEDMIKDTPKGLAVIGTGGYDSVDFQALNGSASGEIVYEIVDGKIGSAISGALYLYRSPDFWKSLVAIGGPKSVVNYGFQNQRGGAFTASAVPGKVAGIRVTDIMRKA